MCNMNPLREHFSFSYFKQLLGTIWPLCISGCSGLFHSKNSTENEVRSQTLSQTQAIGKTRYSLSWSKNFTRRNLKNLEPIPPLLCIIVYCQYKSLTYM